MLASKCSWEPPIGSPCPPDDVNVAKLYDSSYDIVRPGKVGRWRFDKAFGTDVVLRRVSKNGKQFSYAKVPSHVFETEYCFAIGPKQLGALRGAILAHLADDEPLPATATPPLYKATIKAMRKNGLIDDEQQVTSVGRELLTLLKADPEVP